MAEYQLFCWAPTVGDSLSNQQKAYRFFNTEVTEERYRAVLNEIYNILPNPKNHRLNDFFDSLTNEQINKIAKSFPEFHKDGFEFITGRKVESPVINLTGKVVEVTLDGKIYKAIIQ